MRERSGWSGGRQMQMMDTFPSREDQRAAWAFSAIKSPPPTMTLNGYKRAELVPIIKIPRLKTTSIPHLCLLGSCNFHNSGMGITNITRSVDVWSAALVNQTGAAGRHFVRRTSSYGLQKAWTGTQKKNPLSVVHRPIMTRNPMTM
jgi:hypothetical protein